MTQGTNLAGTPGVETGGHPGGVGPDLRRSRGPGLVFRFEEAAVMTLDRPQNVLEMIGECPMVAVSGECCDVIEPFPAMGGVVCLRIVDHLQAMLDAPQFAVSLGEITLRLPIGERCFA